MRLPSLPALPVGLQDSINGLADMGMEQTQKSLADLNLLLGLLQQAGYGVGQVEVEIAIPPKVSVHLKISGPVSEEKLKAILHDHSDRTVITTLVNLLLRANQLRGSIKVENVGFAEIRLATSPQAVMSWKEIPAAV